MQANNEPSVLVATATAPAPAPAPIAPTVDQLVGEGKKFKDLEMLAKGKLEADNHIAKLEAERAADRKRLEELEAIINVTGVKPSGNQPAPAQSAAVDPSQIAELVRKELQHASEEDRAKANVLEADRYLTEYFQDKQKATEFVTEKAKALGMPVSWLIDVAAKSPAALYNLLEVKHNAQQQPGKAPAKPVVNTDAPNFAPNGGPKEGSKEWFDAMRKSNPSRYWSPEVQAQIHKAAASGAYST